MPVFDSIGLKLCSKKSLKTSFHGTDEERKRIQRKQGIQCTDYKQKTALMQHIF